MRLTSLPPRYDVFERAARGDLYATYRTLRDAAPACRAGPATYAIARYADVAALLRDPRLGHQPSPGAAVEAATARVAPSARPNPVLTRLIAGLDPPAHTRVRQLVRAALKSELMESVGARVAGHVDALVDRACAQRRFDAVGELALPLQMRIAADLLDIPAADRDTVTEQATALGRAIILLPFVRPEWGDGQAEARWLRDYVAGLVRARKTAPGRDAISGLLAARVGDDRLDDDEVVDNAVFLFFAGFETTLNVVASGCALLARHPAELARLRQEPSLVRGAVEEVLRYEAPLQWVSRITQAPIELGDQTIGANRVLLLLIGSANHDERQFRDPEAFDVGRHPNPHLTFGGGHHHCMGQPLVRPECARVFKTLAERCRTLELERPPTVRQHPCIRGFAEVPLQLTLA